MKVFSLFKDLLSERKKKSSQLERMNVERKNSYIINKNNKNISHNLGHFFRGHFFKIRLEIFWTISAFYWSFVMKLRRIEKPKWYIYSSNFIYIDSANTMYAIFMLHSMKNCSLILCFQFMGIIKIKSPNHALVCIHDFHKSIEKKICWTSMRCWLYFFPFLSISMEKKC